MDKIKQLLEMQQLLDSISEKMIELKEDLNVVTLSVESNKLISTDISDRVITGLSEINRLNEECKKLYSEFEFNEEMSDSITIIKDNITQTIKHIELSAKMDKYKRFLLLETDDTDTKVLLDAQKAELQKILDNYTDNSEDELKQYEKFVEALLEKSSAKAFSMALELSAKFGNDLLGKAFMEKKVKFPSEKASESEEQITVLPEPTTVTDNTTYAEVNPIEDDSQEIEEYITPDSDIQESSDNVSEKITAEEVVNDLETSEKDSEKTDYQKEIIDRGLLVTEDVFDKPFEVSISNNESKKTGSKIFNKEIKNKNLVLNAVALTCIDKFNSVTPELVASSSHLPVEAIENALEYLQSKGYARKYSVQGIGSFYCSSPRASKALRSKEVRTFLKLNYTPDDNDDVIEDTLTPVLTRIALSKLLTCYVAKKISDRFAKMVSNEVFACRFYSKTEDKHYVCLGAFFREYLDIDDFICEIKDHYCNGTAQTEHFIVAGINTKYAQLLAEFIIEKLNLDSEKFYCYSLIDNKYFKYTSLEQISFTDLFDDSDKEAATEAEITEENTLEEVDEESDYDSDEELPEDITEESTDDLLSDNSENLTDISDTKTTEAVEDEDEALAVSVASSNKAQEIVITEKSLADNSTPEVADLIQPIYEPEIYSLTPVNTNKNDKQDINGDDVLANIYQMISDGNIYCATTYLRALSEYNEDIYSLYKKLAYAVNTPWMRCSYNSQIIFLLYSGSGELINCDIFADYLKVSATLRNFFMNHVSYDYILKSLHDSVKETPIIRESTALTNVVYSLATFKENMHKGADVYAAYRVKDKMIINKKLDSLIINAKSYYDSYVVGQPKNHKHVQRFVVTWKMIFDTNHDMATYLQAIIDKDYEVAELLKEYLSETFISDNCSIEYSNLDMTKLNKFIDEHWDKANTGRQYKTTPLMSGLRNNLIKTISKVLKLMCDWLALVEVTSTLTDDEGTTRYATMKNVLCDNLKAAINDIDKKSTSSSEEKAGAAILKYTLNELIARIEGTYDENEHKYYYIDFLRGNYVLLDDDYLPDMRGKFSDFEELSLSNRILKHSQSVLMSFEEKLEHIFTAYGDDYGTAELIMNYLEDTQGVFYADEYDIRQSIEQAEAEAKINLDDFIENLELAQSYGQIEVTRENKKEKMQKISNEWFEYAKETKNYGFFKTVLQKYREKIHIDAQVRGDALLAELVKLKDSGVIDDTKQKKINKIQELIKVQNYTIAEDLLSRINSDEIDEDVEIFNTDYLKKFIDEYDYNYSRVVDSGRSLSNLIRSRIRNKDDKGASRLVENWMINGIPLGKNKLTNLLETLGFSSVEVNPQPKIIDKIENYIVTVKEVKGRKVNYKHPIAVFGSKASEDGFRVVCLFGRYDADRLIEEFKNISGTKNTLVLLDYALPLSERRRLARKIKYELNDKVFAVLDRVLLMFLVNNYSVQFINQILMCTMMPFSYCQPYVWDSSKIMPPEIFMGRKDELEKIESPAGVNIVYGGRQLGKSALLKMAKMNIDNDENHDRAVFIEIKGLDYKRAARKIGHELHDAGILQDDIDTTDWDELSRAIKRRLQDTKLQYIPYLLLLLDEADTFIESCEEVNFHPFDALKDIQGVGMDRFKFVIAGLHNIVRFKRDAALSNNSVLTHLTSITIKPFSLREARQLLEEPLYYLGLRFPDDKQSLISLILANTNYFPGLIQLYCANLIEAMRKSDYAGYEQIDTPVYEVNPNHIKKVLSDPYFMNKVREKFEITLKLGDDNMYYIIALLMAYLYHQDVNSASENSGFSAKDIIEAAKEYGVKKVANQSEAFINGLMQELLELNIFRQTFNDMYLFSRYSFFPMMGTSSEIEDNLEKYMED